MIIDPTLVDATLLLIAILALLTVPLAAAVFVGTLFLLWLNPAPLPPDFMMNYNLSMRFNSPALLSIPLFALAGELAIAAGIADRLLQVADCFGGDGVRALGPRTIFGCTLFAAISGVGATAVKAESKRLVPALVRAGYSREFAAGALACSAVLAIIIPMSVPLTVYAATVSLVTNVIATAAFLPGLLMAAVLLAIMFFMTRRGMGREDFQLESPAGGLRTAAWRAKWSLLMPLIVLPCLFTGWFTAPEAAAFSCAYCLVVGRFLHGELQWPEVWAALPRAAVGTATILMLTGMGGLFAMLMSGCGYTERVADIVFKYAGGETGAIVAINLFLLVAGCFLDMPAIITLLVPLMLPLAWKCGLSLPHFGVIVVMNLAIGLVTPPQAWNITAAAQEAGVDVWRAARAGWPFLAGMVACTLLVSFSPEMSLWLPRAFGWPV